MDNFEDVVISPNPYYEATVLGGNQSSNTVRIANLPKGSVVTIYTMEGQVVQRLENGINATLTNNGGTEDLEWNLNAGNNVQMNSGIYVVNIAVPNLGKQKSLRWIKL